MYKAWAQQLTVKLLSMKKEILYSIYEKKKLQNDTFWVLQPQPISSWTQWPFTKLVTGFSPVRVQMSVVVGNHSTVLWFATTKVFYIILWENNLKDTHWLTCIIILKTCWRKFSVLHCIFISFLLWKKIPVYSWWTSKN